MCGIAGLISLDHQKPVSTEILRAMSDAIIHRGPDEDGYFQADGVGLASRRLSIIGLRDGQQPVCNQEKTIHGVFNGEFFDYPEQRRALEARGHRFRTSCDSELLPHMWEAYGEEAFRHLKGQFAFALWDGRKSRLILARDRLGICPLYWSEQRGPAGHWLLFASEIKALLKSGMVAPRADLRGIDHTFTFFALPGPLTCFENVSALLPGHFLTVTPGRAGSPPRIEDEIYWKPEFPDEGAEKPGSAAAIDELDSLFRRAVELRLRADVPVVSYLSGGIDSSLVLSMAAQIRGAAPPAFTLKITAPGLDESEKAAAAGRCIGASNIVIPCGIGEIVRAYPRLIEAAECPVSDTCCAALLLLAQAVHREGYKVALTGEGSDETLAGYPWFKLHNLLGWFDAMPGLEAGNFLRRAIVRALGLENFADTYNARVAASAGGSNAWLDLYGLVSTAKLRFYGPRLKSLLGQYVPYEDLRLDLEGLRRWHPLNRSLYLGQRIHLPGLLLSIGGDRVAMHSSVETRYPFLDEAVVAFLAGLDPAWKLRRLKDKYILRRMAERYLPREIAWRPKAMFRAPWDVFSTGGEDDYVAPLLSAQALGQTGYFDASAVGLWKQRLANMRQGGPRRALLEQGLAGVVMTQLWHHIFISDLGIAVPRYA